MELSEAKEILKDWIKCEEVTIRTEENTTVYQERLELFKFLLNYIENESISKEKIRTFIDDLKYEEEIYMRNEDEVMVKELIYLQNRLKELLGE